MSNPPAIQTNPLDPVFSGVPVVYPQTGMVNPTWTKWFVDLREKVNVINATVAALSGGTLKPVIEVHAGANVSVDNTDIQNPIVSATGGGGGGGFISGLHTITSTSYTLTAADSNVLVDFNVTGRATVTIPLNASVAFAAATSIQLGSRSSSLTVTSASSSISVITANVPSGSPQFGGLINVAANLWYLWGNISYAPPITAYQSVVLADSPIAYWPLQEASGTAATDISGNGYSGTYTGGYTLGVPGVAGTAVTLNGTTGYIVAPLVTSNTTAITLEVWVNFNSAAGLKGPFIGLGNGSNGLSMGSGTSSYDTAGNNFIALAERVAWLTPSPVISIPTSGWVHCVVTLNSGAWTFYLNGAQAGTASAGSSTPSGNTYIGTDFLGNADRYFGGSICQCAVYNKVLTASQILSHYQAGA